MYYITAISFSRENKRQALEAHPGPLSQAVQAKLICNLCGVHCVLHTHILASLLEIRDRRNIYRQILFVGKHQQERISELILIQHPLQFLASLADTFSVVRVDDENNTLGVLEVMAPERANLVLSTDIPHSEGDVLVLDSLDVEA